MLQVVVVAMDGAEALEGMLPAANIYRVGTDNVQSSMRKCVA